MENSHLLAQADQALANGQANQGLILLRQYNSSNDNDAGSWHRQAVIEEQIGDFSMAGEAHFRCIEIAPNNAIGYLYGGYWLQQKNQQTDAAALYSLADDLDASVLKLWDQADVSPPTKLRSQEASKVMRRVLSEQHRIVCRNLDNAERIRKAHWVQTSDQPVSLNFDNFAPELFFIPGLSTRPFHSSTEFTWTEQLNQKCSAINKELSHAMEQQLTKESLRPYLGKNFSSHSSLSKLANSHNWQAIDLFKNGQLNSEVSMLFPETLNALNTVPTYNLDNNPFEVFFSFLKPHQSIAPHFGQSNHALTVHLPLDIPDGCYLKVNDQEEKWAHNEVLIFDDSFLHSAHNPSELNRVVLIFSIWHPDLNADERNAVQQSFKARQKWVSERRSRLEKLRANR